MGDRWRQARRLVAVGAAAAYGLLYHLGRTSGATGAERRRPLPGDDLAPRPSLVTTHAATLPAPPAEVWPWLTQMGWHRGGWYTPRWVDRLRARLDWVWIFALDPVRDGGTRLLIRNRGRVAPRWLDLAYLAVIVPADHVMTRGMFRGLAARVRQRPTP
jgi:hypothetical protein